MAVSVRAGTFVSREGIPVRGADEGSIRVVTFGSSLTGLGTVDVPSPHPANNKSGAHSLPIAFDSMKRRAPKPAISPIALSHQSLEPWRCFDEERVSVVQNKSTITCFFKRPR